MVLLNLLCSHGLISLHITQDRDTYRDVRVQRLAVVSDILLANIQHVHLRTGDHDADQGSVFGPGSLNTCTHIG